MDAAEAAAPKRKERKPNPDQAVACQPADKSVRRISGDAVGFVEYDRLPLLLIMKVMGYIKLLKTEGD